MIGCWSALRRIEAFLKCEEQDLVLTPRSEETSATSSVQKVSNKEETNSASPEVVFENATIGLNDLALLRDLNCVCPASQLTLLVGSVACVRRPLWRTVANLLEDIGQKQYPHGYLARIRCHLWLGRDIVSMPNSIRLSRRLPDDCLVHKREYSVWSSVRCC